MTYTLKTHGMITDDTGHAVAGNAELYELSSTYAKTGSALATAALAVITGLWNLSYASADPTKDYIVEITPSTPTSQQKRHVLMTNEHTVRELVVLSTASLAGPVSISGNAGVIGTLVVTGATALINTLDVTGALAVTGAVTLRSNLSVVGALAVTGAAVVTGAASLKSTLDVTGALAVTGATLLRSTLDVVGALAVTGAVTIRNNISVPTSSTLTIGSVMTGLGAITVGGRGTVGNGIIVRDSQIVTDIPWALGGTASWNDPVADRKLLVTVGGETYWLHATKA